MTRVQYTTKVRKDGTKIYTASVEPKRDSDSVRTNNYSLMLLLNWRANCDMRLIICEKSLLRYLLKYVTKPETKSVVLADIISNLLST